jgi:palmitoyl-protein thioesterase
MHGITGTAEKLEDVAEWIREELGHDTYVRSMEVGNGAEDSVRLTMDEQVRIFCENVYADENLKEGFNVIGFSQGGLITRGYLQRCNKFPVINYISWATPHAGQFGILTKLIPPFVSVLLGRAPYSDEAQKSLSLPGYWKDPYSYNLYLEKSSFLADLNNERLAKNATYKKRLTSVKNMMLLHSTEDEVIGPPSSGWFEFYKLYTGPGPQGVIVPLRESLFYKLDFLGIRKLDETGRLHLHTSDCNHAEHPTIECKLAFDLYTLPLLREPWSEVHAFWKANNITHPIVE